MTGVTIPGVGMTGFTGASDRSLVELAATAANRALDDSGYGPDDISSLHIGNVLREKKESLTPRCGGSRG